MLREDLQFDTSSQQVLDITDAINDFLNDAAVNGLLNVFVPHATAGIAIMETGSGSEPDLVDAINNLLPRDNRYRHRHGATGHGADHVLPALISPSITIPVQNGRMELGVWQRVVLVDLNRDNPRRNVKLRLLEG